MKYLLLQDIDGTVLKKGMIVDDEEDDIFMTIKLDRVFYEGNPHAFKKIGEDGCLRESV